VLELPIRRSLLAASLACGLLGGCNQGIVPQQETPETSVPTGWTAVSAGTANLNAVSGLSDTAVWVVGDKGTIGHWDGTQLQFEKSGTQANLRGVFVLSTDVAYAVGDGGTILERGASGWHAVAQGLTQEVLSGVWADATRVVAVGSNGTIVLGGAAPYQLIKATYQSGGKAYTVGENLFGVTGTAGGPATIVGSLGLVLQLNGTTLSRTPVTNFIKLFSAVAAGPNNTYYFVGQQGTIYVEDPATGINPLTGCPATALRAVSTVGTNAWIVGWDGTMCSVIGSKVTSYPYSDNRWFNGVYASSANSLWVVGASGTLLHGLPLPSQAQAAQ
jgi:hypothetical protein